MRSHQMFNAPAFTKEGFGKNTPSTLIDILKGRATRVTTPSCHQTANRGGNCATRNKITAFEGQWRSFSASQFAPRRVRYLMCVFNYVLMMVAP